MARATTERRFWARRLAQMALVVLGIGTVNFFLLHLAPGDAAQVLAGESGSATPNTSPALRRQFGLDPAAVQFGHYLLRPSTFDLGFSHPPGLRWRTLILDRLPADPAFDGGQHRARGFWSGSAGLPRGAARRRGRGRADLERRPAVLRHAGLLWSADADRGVSRSGSTGFRSAACRASRRARPRSPLSSTSPTTSSCPRRAGPVLHGDLYPPLRASVLDVQDRDFVRTGAKGLRSGRIARRHVLRNATLPVVTTVGVQIGSILGGAVLVETVFSSGLGSAAVAFEAAVPARPQPPARDPLPVTIRRGTSPTSRSTSPMRGSIRASGSRDERFVQFRAGPARLADPASPVGSSRIGRPRPRRPRGPVRRDRPPRRSPRHGGGTVPVARHRTDHPSAPTCSGATLRRASSTAPASPS